jgi:iron complex outermembrane receptor protein
MTSRHMLATALLATTILAAAPAYAQTAVATPEVDMGNDIIVTAQKREENLQSVPISIQALNTRKLDELNVSNFNAFSQLLPSVSFQSTQPGSTVVYMRGVSSGGDGNHSGPLPSVGFYLDEQPVTTIGGTIDIHIYDIARIESLAGPQGTLYGASSEAGTVRIITNKPSTAGWEGRVDGEVNTVRHGGQGGRLEGMINAPLSSNAALRVVGWYQHDAGYIDNVAGTRTFLGAPILDGAGQPTGAYAPGITINNAAVVKKNFNTVDMAGGRAALKIDLDENWTVTPTILYQDQKNHGNFSYDPSVGDLQVQKFATDYRHDRFVQGALTIEGKVGNWDLTYAAAYLDRKVNAGSDYTDYSEAYDQFYSSVGGLANYFYFQNAAGQTISPTQFIVASDHFKKMSQELRVASPQGDRFRVVAGLFFQRQSNLIHQDYQVAGLAPLLSVNGAPGTLWLTQQHRVDKDYAAFGEASFDILPNLTVTAGGRGYIYDNSLIGFFGFGRNPAYVQGAAGNPPPNAAGSSRTGVAGCLTTEGITLRDAQLQGRPTTLLPATVAGGPCTNLGTFNTSTGSIDPKKTEGQGFTHKLNLTWKATPDLMFYGTWSRGFRPGGINRRSTVAPYAPDFLTNYEIGMKSTLWGGKLRFNATIYQQDWKKFQFAFLGANSFTEIHNGPNARIRGIEADINLRPIKGLTLTTAAAYTEAKTRQNLCFVDDPTYSCTGAGNFVSTPKGTRLPITPRFKINGTARYVVPVNATARVYGQAVVVHQSSASSDIRTAIPETFTGTIVNPAEELGRLRAYTTADFSFGVELTSYTAELFVQNAFDERADLSRGAECCQFRPTITTNTPRTIGLRLGAKF